MDKIERDENASVELIDVRTAMHIMADIDGGTSHYAGSVLPQWVHAIRKYEHERLLRTGGSLTNSVK